MALDLDGLPPARKLALIADGAEFGSDDTHAQATQTLQGLEKYADKLKVFGLPLSDGQRLDDARGLLSDAGFGRHEARTKKKTLNATLVAATRAARTARLRGRSVLESAKAALLNQGAAEPAAAVQATLDTTADPTKTGEDLAVQLDQLGAALDVSKAPAAAAAAADRGGPETSAKLSEASTALRAAVKSKPGQRGTPEETQRLDLIDGIIIDICRRARDAAEAASKELGDPAILKAFKLDKLYASSGGAKKEEAGAATGGGNAPAGAAGATGSAGSSGSSGGSSGGG